MENKTVHKKEPFMRIVSNPNHSAARAWIIRGVALVIALLACGLFVNITAGVSLKDTFISMWNGTFGRFGNATSMRIKCWDSAVYAAKLLCIAVALAPAFKMRFWNIGAEGQVIMGGLVTAIVMREAAGTLSGFSLYACMILACIVFGAVWGVIPAIFRAKFGTNETLFTLMMNYVAMKIMDYFYNTWKGRASALEQINTKTQIGWLPDIFGHGYTINIIVFLLLAVFIYFYLGKTKHGYEISVVGESTKTAQYAGINVSRVIIRTMAISGAICGLCGGLTVAGQTHSIATSADPINSITSGYGFTAIIVAWLAKFNTIGMIGISVLIIFLEKGTGALANNYPAFATGAGNVLIGLVLFFIIGSEFFIRYRIVFAGMSRRKKAAKEASAHE